MSSPRYIRPKAIAELLGVHERTVRRWISDGKLPSRRLVGARLVAAVDLERLLDTPLKLDEIGDDEEE